MAMENIRDRVWLTARIRMTAEDRYRLYDIVSHIFLSYMSMLMIIATVLADDLSKGVRHFGAITISLTIFVFTASLIVAGFRNRERANQHRDCYLALQSLLDSCSEDAELSRKYHEILPQHPNHSPRDHDDLVLNRTLFGNTPLWNGENKITWSWPMIIRKICRFSFFWALTLSPPISVTALFICSYLSCA